MNDAKMMAVWDQVMLTNKRPLIGERFGGPRNTGPVFFFVRHHRFGNTFSLDGSLTLISS